MDSFSSLLKFVKLKKVRALKVTGEEVDGFRKGVMLSFYPTYLNT